MLSCHVTEASFICTVPFGKIFGKSGDIKRVRTSKHLRNLLCNLRHQQSDSETAYTLLKYFLHEQEHA